MDGNRDVACRPQGSVKIAGCTWNGSKSSIEDLCGTASQLGPSSPLACDCKPSGHSCEFVFEHTPMASKIASGVGVDVRSAVYSILLSRNDTKSSCPQS